MGDRDASYGLAVGERLRQIRRQKRMSLQDVEALSDQEFKASVLGAYERGERSISVPRLARLAGIYRVPVDQLLPEGSTSQGDGSGGDRSSHEAKLRLDLTQLASMGGAEAQMISRYVRKIQVQRQDFNGRVLSIRRDDLRLIACILGLSDDLAWGRLEEMGLQMSGPYREEEAEAPN
ncbi:MAG: transcriptional regulator [Microthrixaceae bacterium]|nr:transcriptional regulator [Microthrixaceae bacterium]